MAEEYPENKSREQQENGDGDAVMDVTKVEAVTKTRFKVELNGQFAFVLYQGELTRFGIREGTELARETYLKIKKEIVLKRAKLRALHLLSDMDRTEAELRKKLKMAMFPDDMIEEAIDYVRSFSYLNDERYVQNFIQSRKSSKSRKELLALLCAKGIPVRQAEEALDSCCDREAQREAIRRIIRKKKIDMANISEQERHKLYGYLSRKGFQYEDICHVTQTHYEI